MNRLRRVFRLLLVLWAGSLWSLAAWVAPTLFAAQGDRHLAGVLAGKLFSIEAYVGVAVAVMALLLPGRSKYLLGYLAAVLLAANEWVLRGFMHSAQIHGSALGLTFGAWHGVSAALYLVGCLCVVVMIYKGEVLNG